MSRSAGQRGSVSPAVCSSDQVRAAPATPLAKAATNNASGARTVTLHISDIRLVEVRANLRYRIG
ncbi:hypothetical protein ACWEJ7_01335 [Streptomyces albidoflavus]